MRNALFQGAPLAKNHTANNRSAIILFHIDAFKP